MLVRIKKHTCKNEQIYYSNSHAFGIQAISLNSSCFVKSGSHAIVEARLIKEQQDRN